MNAQTLWDTYLRDMCNPDWLAQTRVHSIASFGHEGADVWVKREDESGFGVSGTKRRKFASLIPFLLEQKRGVALIGGANANQVVSGIQVLREHAIPFRLYLKQAHQPSGPLQGNAFLRFLLAEEREIRWVSPAEWPQVEMLAAAECPEYEVLPEGGFHAAALPGACSLYMDIRRNEAALGKSFDHIFIDSGTGFSAAALALMLGLRPHKTLLHVVLMADDADFFQTQYTRLMDWLSALTGQELPFFENLNLYKPSTARSFGSVNATVLAAVSRFAKTYGILTDPIYTAKLFLTAEDILAQKKWDTPCLIIHSGGGTGLMGFSGKLT